MTTEPLVESAVKTERRYWQRKKFRGDIQIEWGSVILNGAVRDIGPRGLFVELAPQLWLGAAFRAWLNVQPVLLLDCVVARVEPGMGIALTFDVAEENGKAQLESLLLSLPAV
ncbi:MAG TPA: PilZ domain-containing protein [Candidatus Acidoferrales bacterium]|jgi:hypothetical protein